jgi:hypothetical protein
MDLVPKEHKDVASDFSPKVLMYSCLQPGTIISINDKVLNDSIGALINQVFDSTSWRNGVISATVVGKERINLEFPPRCVCWMNSNKRVTEYGLREVDPMAIEGRFITFEKTYSEDEKKKIFVERNVYNSEDNTEKINKVRNYINHLYENPKTISCSEEIRSLIWKKSSELGIKSIRIIGRNLTMCQVIALTEERECVITEDVEEIFSLLKANSKVISENSPEDVYELIKHILIPLNIYKALPTDKKLLYSSEELLKNSKIPDLCQNLEKLIKENRIGKDLIKVGINRKLMTCYYLM